MALLVVDWLFFVLAHLARIITDILTVILAPVVYAHYLYERNNFFTTKKCFKSIFITGGSSGIGLGLAKVFAQDAVASNTKITLILTGTNKNRLTRAKTELDAIFKGPESSISSSTVICEQLDVTDTDAMKQFINKMDESYQLDLVVANAGIAPNMAPAPHYFVSSAPILDINCRGVLNTILPAMARFQERKKGHLAVVGSVAGFMPSPFLGTYSGSKAYLRFLCDDLRPKLKMIGDIDVTYIAPGYVKSRITEDAPAHVKDMALSAEYSGRRIVDGLQWNESYIMYPGKTVFQVLLYGTMHPLVNSLLGFRLVNRDIAVPSVGFFHEVDPNDEFGGEC